MAALEQSEKRLAKLEVSSAANPPAAPRRKSRWFEKFRWFFTSEGFLVIGGRDATTNELVIKKHTEAGDIVLHTDMAGSPFFVIKSDGRAVGRQSIREAADATASYSRAWKAGLATTSVFYVKPEQVTKQAQTGEYLAKGAFMIQGKTTYVDNEMRLAVGIKDGMIIGGPVSAVKAAAEKLLVVVQGEHKPSDIAKSIQKQLGGELDEIIRFLPSGGARLVRQG